MLIEVGLNFGDSGKFTNKGVRTYRRAFVGTSNNRYDHPLSIVRDRLCPKPGDRDPYDPTARLTDVEAVRRDETSFVWDIYADSSNDYEEDDINPLSQRAKVTIKTAQYTRLTTTDGKGRPITTTARSLLPVSIDDSYWVIAIEKNIPTLPNFLTTFNNKVNSGAFFLRGLIIPRRKLQCKALHASDEEASYQGRTIYYVKLQYELHYRREGFIIPQPNVDYVELKPGYVPKRNRLGQIEKDDSTGKIKYVFKTKARQPILIGGEKVKEPWPLDSSGKALPEDYTASQITQIKPEPYQEAPLTLLPR